MTKAERPRKMYECSGCGLAIHGDMYHHCNVIEVAWFRAREEDVLITEIISLRSRCEELGDMVVDIDMERQTAETYRSRATGHLRRTEAQRDEALERCEEFEADLAISDARVKSIEHEKLVQERDEAREWARRYKADGDRAWAAVGAARIMCADLSAQLASARNDALDEAIFAMLGSQPWVRFEELVKLVRALKS